MKYTVDAIYRDTMTSFFATLTKRASRTGTDLQFSISEKRIERRRVPASMFERAPWVLRDVPVIDIEVNTDCVGFDGWQLVGVTFQEQGQMFSKVLDKTLPKETFEHNTFCTHCQTNRRRTRMYVFLKDGNIERVGSSCAKDFFGVSTYKAFNELLGFIDELDEFFDGLRTAPTYSVEAAVMVAAHYIKTQGFVSAAKARDEGEIATGEWVLMALQSPKQDFVNEVLAIPGIRDLAQRIIEWLKSKESENDFFRNCARVASLSYLPANRDTGFFVKTLTAGVQSYRRWLAEESKEKIVYKAERYGIEKKRVRGVEAKVLDCKIFGYGDFGPRWKTELEVDGHLLICFGSTGTLEEHVGQTVKVSFTPGDTGEYKGNTQTMISRIALA